MLTQLKPDEYGRIRPLLKNYLGQSLYAHGVIDGKYKGDVFVDDAKNPKSAFLRQGAWANLLGQSDNMAFNQALGNGLANKTIIDKERAVLFIVDPSEEWNQALQTLVPNRIPIDEPRTVFMARQQCQAPSLPSGFSLHFINDALVQQIDGELPGDVQKVLDLRRNTAVPDDFAFGFAILNGRSCVAWAVVDFIVGREGEIRLVTQPAHRRQGFATIVSAAAINYGLDNGLEAMSWNVSNKNEASIRTAEKLGLVIEQTSMEYVLIFPEVGYLINTGFNHLDNGRFIQTLKTTEKMRASDENILKKYGLFLAGAAYAGLGKTDSAFKHLDLAIESGFVESSEFKNCPPLDILKDSPQWQQLVNKIETSH